MRFTVSQSALSEALAIVSKGMSGNATLPLLSGIYLKAEGGTLELQTNNLVISVRHRVAANVTEDGETVVAGRTLVNIVKTLPDAAVSFDGRARSLSIACDKARFRLNALDPADWTPFPDVAADKSVSLPADLLKQMVDRTYRVTSRETSRPILQGIHITVENNVVRLVATDSYRLAVVDTSVDTSSLEGRFEAIIPGGVFHDVISMPKVGEAVSVGAGDSQVVFSFGTTTFVSQKIRGQFTDYRQILPKSHATAMTVKTDEFAAALRRMSVIAQANSSVRLEVKVEDKVLSISASSNDAGESSEAVPVDAEGSDVTVAFNYRYLSDCIAATADRGEVRVEMQGGSKPAVFISNAQVNYLCVLMPVWF